MKLLQKSDGEWFRHEAGAEFLVRPIPAGKVREIEYQHFGRTRQVEMARGVHRMTIDTEKVAAVQRAKAEYALLDSKEAEIDAWDEDSAIVLAAANGGGVAVGDTVKLDGHWSGPIKSLVFDAVPDLASWVANKAGTFGFRAEEEEGKG